MLNLAPRCTATSPAAPRMVATHSKVTATPGDTWMDCTTQGGPTDGMTTGGYIQSLRTSDAKIMIRIELPMPVAVSQLRTRVPRVKPASSRTGPSAGGLEISPVVLLMQLLLVLSDM